MYFGLLCYCVDVNPQWQCYLPRRGAVDVVGPGGVCPVALSVIDSGLYPLAPALRMCNPVVLGRATIALAEPVERVVTVRVINPAPLSVTVTSATPVLAASLAVTSTVCCPFTGVPIAAIESVPAAGGASTVTVAESETKLSP